MSCAPGIYDRLSMTSPPGGNWTYIGFNATSNTGPWTGTPAVPLVNVAANTSLASWGYNFTLTTDNKTPGYYRFQYDYVGGSDDATIYIQSDTICAGQDYGITIEEGTALTFNLFSLISGGSCPSPQTGGTWTNVDSAPGFNPTTSNLDTTTILVGQYVFEYSIADTPDQDCSDCSTSARVTLTVASPAALDATIEQSNVTCLYTYRLAHPVTDATNQVYFSIADEDQNARLSYKVQVLNCDSEIVFEEEVSIANPMDLGVEIFTGALVTGGSMEDLRLHMSTGPTITVPLSPLTAMYSGVGGTTNATALTYNSGTPDIFYNAVRIALVNYLGSLGFSENTNYKIVRIGRYENGTPAQVVIVLGGKRNPSGTWIGVKKSGSLLRFRPSGGAIVSTVNGLNYVKPIVFSRSFSALPCMSGSNALVINVNTLAYHLNLGLFDFNSIEISSSDLSVTPAGTLSRSCADKLLTANPTGCSGTVSYAWQTGAITQSIKVPYIAGVTHTVDVSCTSPSSTVTKSTTL